MNPTFAASVLSLIGELYQQVSELRATLVERDVRIAQLEAELAQRPAPTPDT